MILRSDGTPTYHLASTVDDVDYEITHVAHGEDLLPSTPKHILLTRALGAEDAPSTPTSLSYSAPTAENFSKRLGAISMSAYRDEGYLADAVFNYLSLLGWSLDGDRTIFSRDEAIAAFDLIDVSRNPAVFDPDKLAWMNGEYIRALDPGEFRCSQPGPTSKLQWAALSMKKNPPGSTRWPIWCRSGPDSFPRQVSRSCSCSRTSSNTTRRPGTRSWPRMGSSGSWRQQWSA